MNNLIENIKFLFWSRPKISYGVTVCNEAEELDSLLERLVSYIDKKDEVIVLSDRSKITDAVQQVIDKYRDRIKHISYPLDNDFSTFKNKLIDHASGDYLFQIDADELPNSILLKDIKQFLYLFKNRDAFFIPRVNYVEGVTEEYTKKWREFKGMDDKGRINYPDYQMRLFRLGKDIRWERKVHEIVVNFSGYLSLPADTEDYCLYHSKTLEKQIRQNEYYDTLY